MIFDLLTSPKGQQFDPRMKILLAFCSATKHMRRDFHLSTGSYPMGGILRHWRVPRGSVLFSNMLMLHISSFGMISRTVFK